MDVLAAFFSSEKECFRCGTTENLKPRAYDEVTGEPYLWVCPRCEEEARREREEHSRKVQEEMARWEVFDEEDGFPA